MNKKEVEKILDEVNKISTEKDEISIKTTVIIVLLITTAFISFHLGGYYHKDDWTKGFNECEELERQN